MNQTTRLTQEKGLGAAIEVDGKKIALGIPGRGGADKASAVNAAADIPLGRPGSPEEGAAVGAMIEHSLPQRSVDSFDSVGCALPLLAAR
jgi:hypothetical protein